MRVTDEELKRALGPTPECPDVALLASNHLSAAEQDHLLKCPYCQSELALYRSFEEAEPTRDEASSVGWIQERLRGTQWSKAEIGRAHV